MVIVAVVFYYLAQQQSVSAALETTQRQNIELAQTIARMQPRDLIDLDGRADIELMRSLAVSVMKINPSLEVYLLNDKGTVIAHAMDGVAPITANIDLEPVRSLAMPTIAAPRFPILSMDPLRPGELGAFSAAALGKGTTPDGYLYIMLNGANSLMNDGAPVPDTLRNIGLSIIALLLVAIGTVIWVFRHLTRPLRELTSAVRSPNKEELLDVTSSDAEIGILTNEIVSMRGRIDQQLTKLRRQDSMRRELVSNVSHDLRTPLANVQGYVETLIVRSDQLSDSERSEYLAVVMRQCRRLGQRIDDLFELSKLDASGKQPEPSPISIADLISDIVASYSAREIGPELKIEFVAGGFHSVQVMADIAMIARVLENLIDNAIRHSQGQGTIRIDLSQADSADSLTVRIANSNGLIEAKNLPFVFERYWRASDDPATSQVQSSGLGLAIVKRILDLHQAPIRVASNDRFGTIFAFDLPMVSSMPSDDATVDSERATAGSRNPLKELS
jgi:signal transduction histidine kinase